MFESTLDAYDLRAFDRAMQSLFVTLGREAITKMVNISPDDSLAARIEFLADKCREGELKEFEREEYVGYVRANKMAALLKQAARRYLRSTGR